MDNQTLIDAVAATIEGCSGDVCPRKIDLNLYEDNRYGACRLYPGHDDCPRCIAGFMVERVLAVQKRLRGE